jgi:hypothetical protein
VSHNEKTVKQPYFCELPFAEQLLLWSIRTWMRGYELRTSIDERLFEAFNQVQIPRVAGLLDKMMRIVVVGHHRTINIHCPCYRLVGNDERTLLNVIAGYQAGHRGKTWFPLCRFLRPNTAQCLDKLLNEMAEVLTTAKLNLGHFQSPLKEPPSLPPIPAPGVVSMRVHFFGVSQDPEPNPKAELAVP